MKNQSSNSMSKWTKFIKYLKMLNKPTFKKQSIKKNWTLQLREFIMQSKMLRQYWVLFLSLSILIKKYKQSIS